MQPPPEHLRLLRHGASASAAPNERLVLNDSGVPQPLRAMVVGNHPALLAGVRVFLERGNVQVVGEAGRLADALLAVRRHAPDVLVVDADLADGDSVAAIERLRGASAGCRILILGSDREPQRIRQAFDSGADGYVLGSTSEAGLVAAVRDVADGRRHVDPTLAASLLGSQPATESEPLSAREREVLQLIARGHTTRELAARLFISPRTVEGHRRSIMRKLRLTTRAEMVSYALHAGMVDTAAP